MPHDISQYIKEVLVPDTTHSSLEKLTKIEHYQLHGLPDLLLTIKDFIYYVEDYNTDNDPVIESYVKVSREIILDILLILSSDIPISEPDTPLDPRFCRQESDNCGYMASLWDTIDNVFLHNYTEGLDKKNITGASKNDLKNYFLSEVINEIDNSDQPDKALIKSNVLTQLLTVPKYKCLSLLSLIVSDIEGLVYDEIKELCVTSSWDDHHREIFENVLEPYYIILPLLLFSIIRLHSLFNCIERGYFSYIDTLDSDNNTKN